MMRRWWNAFVRWSWYAAGCPARFPLRRIPDPAERVWWTPSRVWWDVCDPFTGRPRLIVPGRHAARAVAALVNRSAAAYGSSFRVDYARRGAGWIR